MVPTFQYPRHRSQPPVLSAISLIVLKCCPPTTVSYDERDENHREPFRADDGWWSNTSHRKRFRSLFAAAAVCGRTMYWRTIPEDNIPCRFLWIKQSNYSTHSTFGGRLYWFRHVYGLTTRSELTRDIAQHIWAKLHLILTVVVISRPIELWK